MQFTELTLETVAESATGAVEFVFLPKRPLPFRAGQAGLFIVPGGGAKPFTFTSDNRTSRISIATTQHSGSKFKRALAALRPGDRLHVIGAIGNLPSPISPNPRSSSRRASASRRSCRLPGSTTT